MPLVTIDGNRDDNLVLFNHDGHVEREGGQASCSTCHHLNMPFDRSSSCGDCHQDMYEPTALFDHSAHVAKLEGNAGCAECHSETAPVKGIDSAAACADCHQEPAARMKVIPAAQPRWREAPGYMDAMHGACVTCHTLRAQMYPARFGELLYRCDACHNADNERALSRMAPARATADNSAGHRVATGGQK